MRPVLDLLHGRLYRVLLTWVGHLENDYHSHCPEDRVWCGEEVCQGFSYADKEVGLHKPLA